MTIYIWKRNNPCPKASVQWPSLRCETSFSLRTPPKDILIELNKWDKKIKEILCWWLCLRECLPGTFGEKIFFWLWEYFRCLIVGVKCHLILSKVFCLTSQGHESSVGPVSYLSPICPYICPRYSNTLSVFRVLKLPLMFCFSYFCFLCLHTEKMHQMS